MGDVRIAGNMARKSIVRDMSGNIINLLDETNGGYIIRNRQVVNPERYQELLDIEKDKREAAQAIVHQKVDPQAPDRTAPPGRVEALEKRVEDMDSKLDAILKAIKK